MSSNYNENTTVSRKRKQGEDSDATVDPKTRRKTNGVGEQLPKHGLVVRADILR
jgi:hypothetical protein